MAQPSPRTLSEKTGSGTSSSEITLPLIGAKTDLTFLLSKLYPPL